MRFNEIKMAGTCKVCGRVFDYGYPEKENSLEGLMAEDYTEQEAAEMYTKCRECLANEESKEMGE